MQVYHFLNAQYGLEAIRRRRVKISLINELNDPFELLGMNLARKEYRRAFARVKATLAKNRGILCFSKDWQNPVLWSHYSDKHRGLCLGFSVPNHLLAEISYSAERIAAKEDWLLSQEATKLETMKLFLSTKFSHWAYEQEFRSFVELDHSVAENGLYFADFGSDLELAQVIVGAYSSISRREIRDALGADYAHIPTSKARLAFKSFKVVANKRQSLWSE